MQCLCVWWEAGERNSPIVDAIDLFGKLYLTEKQWDGVYKTKEMI